MEIIRHDPEPTAPPATFDIIGLTFDEYHALAWAAWRGRRTEASPEGPGFLYHFTNEYIEATRGRGYRSALRIAPTV